MAPSPEVLTFSTQLFHNFTAIFYLPILSWFNISQPNSLMCFSTLLCCYDNFLFNLIISQLLVISSTLNPKPNLKDSKVQHMFWYQRFITKTFKTPYLLIIKSLECCNMSIHLSTLGLALWHYLQSFENVIRGSLKSFFQVNPQVNITLYLTEATTLRHSKEIIGLKPSWCAFLFDCMDFKINFISFIGDKQNEKEPWDMLYGSCWWDKNNHLILMGAQENKKCERWCKLLCKQCLKQSVMGINCGRFGGLSLVDGVGFKTRLR